MCSLLAAKLFIHPNISGEFIWFFFPYPFFSFSFFIVSFLSFHFIQRFLFFPLAFLNTFLGISCFRFDLTLCFPGLHFQKQFASGCLHSFIQISWRWNIDTLKKKILYGSEDEGQKKSNTKLTKESTDPSFFHFMLLYHSKSLSLREKYKYTYSSMYSINSEEIPYTSALQTLYVYKPL